MFTALAEDSERWRLEQAWKLPPAQRGGSNGGIEMNELSVDQQGGVATVVLNRPERRNALSLELLTALTATMQALGRDGAIHVIVLGAAGPAFCAGHDLDEMHGRDEGFYRELFDVCTNFMQLLRSLPQPVIARVQGAAIAGGCHLVAACDLAVASTGARFGVPGPRLGLTGTTAMVEVSRLVGRRRALELLLIGEPIDAATAMEWGLVNRVVPPDDLDAATADLAELIAGASASVTGAAKRAFYKTLELETPAAYREAADAIASGLVTPDGREGVAAFVERRAPRWSS